MEEDEAFCTFDLGSKILPQQYREAQSAYFGKKRISVLVGSFIWKDSTTKLASTVTTITRLSPPSYCTQSYIVAITDAAQTELDTLSAGEIITKQFKTDYPHIKKLHKRTDNAGNFSSYATPEVERVDLGTSESFSELLDSHSVIFCSLVLSHRLGMTVRIQKGKDICDRVCGVAKARMRSWAATGNDLLNGIDIKEGMEYAGGIKNTKVTVAEIVPDQGRYIIMEEYSIPSLCFLSHLAQQTYQMYLHFVLYVMAQTV